MTMASITLHQLHTYHSIDREIFSRLVIISRRDPAKSLLVMALWLWLEEKGCVNIILKLTNLTNDVLNALADEATLCLKCLELDTLPMLAVSVLPLTARILGKSISLEMLHRNKFTAISGIKSFLNTVCARIFTDILHCVLSEGRSQVIANQPLVMPGFPHPVFGDVAILPRSIENDFLVGGLWGWDPINSVSEDDRTMFLTFSRGFPVTGEEVTELFTRICGDCVVSVHMQENNPSCEQPLFARMILRSVAAVDQILNGRRVAKFRINGKHIWARKYERRDHQIT